MLRLAVRRARVSAAAALAVCLAAVLAAVAGPGRARADVVRDDQMWVLNAVSAPAAWQISQGKGVIVAVIDSGVYPAAEDLANSVISGPDYTGVGTPSTDPNWGVHGTWMASLVAGHGHGGAPGSLGPSGIVGTAPQSTVLSIRVITDRTDPGFAAYRDESPERGQQELARAIRYAVSHHAGVISMSLGYDMPSRPVRIALQDALNHNVVVVASSGNSGTTTQARKQGYAPYSFPADYLGVLGVGAVGRSGQPAPFSSENISVQVAAPGVRVPAEGRDNQYWLVSGTSPACALTAGVAALIKSRYPGLAAPQIREAIISTTHNKPPGGYSDRVGFGTVDAVAALRAASRLDRLDATTAARTGAKAKGGVARSARPDSVPAHRYFGGGPAAVPAAPVGARGVGTLILLLLLGLGCLVIVMMATWRLLPVRRPAGYGGPAVAADDALGSSPFPWQAPSPGRHAAQDDGPDDAGRG